MVRLPNIFPVACHTDNVGPGSTFVAIQGYATNGVQFIPQALERGATKIILADTVSLDAQLWQLLYKHACVVQRVPDTRLALAQLSAKAAGYPSKKLKFIGITGTKGKTTTSHLAFHMLQKAGISSALISSVTQMINEHKFKSSLIPPQPDYLHQFLKVCVEHDVEWVVMEIAAHAIPLHRIEGIVFDAVVITNIAREHLEFFTSIDDYAAAKIKLLSYRTPNAPAWLNKNDERLIQVRDNHVYYFSLKDAADIMGTIANNQTMELACAIQSPNYSIEITCPRLMGEYNAANILAALAAVDVLTIAPQILGEAIKTFPGVTGRLEIYALPNNAHAIIDYAHNPLSYQALFSMLRLRTHYLIVVFGAGGDRDRGRRPEMGALVAKYADHMFITTDNPRSEDPRTIVQDILQGIPESARTKVTIELDREQAIRQAYAQSHQGTIIALVGKGPDEYQLIGTQKLPFSERSILKSL